MRIQGQHWFAPPEECIQLLHLQCRPSAGDAGGWWTQSWGGASLCLATIGHRRPTYFGALGHNDAYVAFHPMLDTAKSNKDGVVGPLSHTGLQFNEAIKRVSKTTPFTVSARVASDARDLIPLALNVGRV